MRDYNNYHSIQQRLESQKHWMNLLCMGKKKLFKYMDKYPDDLKALKALHLRGLTK
jgi:hypothetical protein